MVAHFVRIVSFLIRNRIGGCKKRENLLNEKLVFLFIYFEKIC